MKSKKMIDRLQLKILILDALYNRHYGLYSFLKSEYTNINNIKHDFYYSFCINLADKLSTEFFED